MHLVLIEAMVNSDLGGGAVDGNDNINLWIDPENVSSLDALGSPDVSLEDFALFSNAGLQSFTLEGSDITGDGVLYDEFSLGQALSDAVAPVPEPASIIIWSLTGLGLVCFSCHRWKVANPRN